MTWLSVEVQVNGLWPGSDGIVMSCGGVVCVACGMFNPIAISLTKRETLRYLQNDHCATDPVVFEVCIAGEVQ